MPWIYSTALLTYMYKIISTGSKHGNSVFLFGMILIDIGIPFSKLNEIYKDIKVVLISHVHSDHININTLTKLVSLRPSLRIAVGEHMLELVKKTNCKNIDILDYGKWYDYSIFKIAIFKTYHDVPSNGWRIKYNDYKVFFCTDTEHLKGIKAKGYTHYFIETNYDEEIIYDVIEKKKEKGIFAHEQGSINSHLSKQQAHSFYLNNKSDDSVFISLHESETAL